MRKVDRCKCLRPEHLGLCLFLVICAIVAGSQTEPARERPTPFRNQLRSSTAHQSARIQERDQLLDLSYQLGQKLQGEEQIPHLTELVNMVSEMKPLPSRASEWSLQLFDRAAAAKSVTSRLEAQKSAVALISKLNAQMGMDLLPKMAFQPPRSHEMIDEDPRATSARVVFLNFLVSAKPQDLSLIMREANLIAANGQYPYRAMAEIIDRLPAQPRDATSAILLDALRSYKAEEGFSNRDEEFLALLSSLRKSSTPDKLIAQALEAFVRRLWNSPTPTPESYYAEIQTPDGKVFPFTDRNDALLFQAFPLIRRYAPNLAAKLQTQNPKLRLATGSMLYAVGKYWSGDPTSKEAEQQHQKWLEESLLQRIKQSKDCDPEAALDLAQRLTDLSSRIVGFSAVVPGLARVDLKKARNIYKEQSEAVINLFPRRALDAHEALAEASYFVGTSIDYEPWAKSTLNLGLGIVLADDGAAGIQERKGFNALRKLVVFTASHSPNILGEEIQRLPDGWIKAYLLLYEAAGLGLDHSRSDGHCNTRSTD